MTTRTLADLYRDAGVTRPPAFAPFVTLRNAPFKSQVHGLSLCLHHQWYGLFDETGSGKSTPAVAAALYHIGNGNRTVVVTLANLIYQFGESVLEEFQGIEKYVDVYVLDEPPAKRKKLFEEWDANNSWPQMVILSYELFAYHKLHEVLKSRDYDVLICDESQKWKNPEGALAKRIKAYAGDPNDPQTAFIPMTGTPMHTYLTDCYVLLTLLSPDAYLSYEHFVRRHCVFKKIRLNPPKVIRGGKILRYIKELVGYKNHDELSKHLYKRARRVLKRDIPELAQLKDPIITEVPVRLDTKHLELYKKLSVERFLELGNGELITALQEQELRQKVLQIVTCPELFLAPGVSITNNVLGTVLDLIEREVGESKVILFLNFRESVKFYAGVAQERGWNPALMFGELSKAEREVNRNKFLHDPSCRVLVANPKSAGAGFNFQGVSHTSIFAEPTGSPGDFKQAMDRIVRPGQLWQCNIYVIKAMATVAPNAIKDMLRRDTEINRVTLDSRMLRHFYEVA